MFTGIVEELGRFRGADDGRFTFEAERVLEGTTTGDSVAVNGCCLTVVEAGDGWWRSDVVDETLRRTTLGRLAPGDGVNLERALRLDDRLGGHLLQGHVDGVGTVTSAAPELAVRPPPGLLRYIAVKGSIAVDGVSLTVAVLDDEVFGVAIIPHTAQSTTLGRLHPGDLVNLEVDLIARYVARLLGE